jgi:hypothetical protein
VCSALRQYCSSERLSAKARQFKSDRHICADDNSRMFFNIGQHRRKLVDLCGYVLTRALFSVFSSEFTYETRRSISLRISASRSDAVMISFGGRVESDWISTK